MEWLNKILEGVENGEEIAGQIKKELPLNFIPKSKYNQLVEEKRQLEQQSGIDKNQAVKGAVLEYTMQSLSDSGEILDSAVVNMLIDKEQISFNEEGKLMGLNEQIDALKKDKPYLFKATKAEGRSPFAGDGAPMGVTKEQFQKMGYRERLELYNSNPELYKYLTE
ncbi:MAG: phage scaffolding protein [Oscillospiraceae bacterium]|nr:phage scaffolding protein [Oscillospiraceae bacterium]